MPVDEAWQVVFLSARDSYVDQKMNTVTLISGVWPHQKNMAVVIAAVGGVGLSGYSPSAFWNGGEKSG
jgi:hypothetical protein